MLVIGTKPEYFDAVWVRNEWSRYLKIVREDRSKLLIPCYRDMDAYDLPEEFSHLQAQDMSKIGFINDVIRGIKKVLNTEKNEPKASKGSVVHKTTSANVENLLKRGNLALEDEKWEEANNFFEQVLNENVEEYRAYIGKLCVDLKISNEDALINVIQEFPNYANYKKACKFGGYEVERRLFELYQQGHYDLAVSKMNNAQTLAEFEKIRKIFTLLGNYKDSNEKALELKNRINIDLDETYNSGIQLLKSESLSDLKEAAIIFDRLTGWRDSDNLIKKAKERIDIIDKKI